MSEKLCAHEKQKECVDPNCPNFNDTFHIVINEHFNYISAHQASKDKE